MAAYVGANNRTFTCNMGVGACQMGGPGNNQPNFQAKIGNQINLALVDCKHSNFIKETLFCKQIEIAIQTDN